jgi:L-xylulokinase
MSEKETFWLGIDCGGTYLKAGLYNSQGKEFAIERQSVHTLSPQPGWAERDMRSSGSTARQPSPACCNAPALAVNKSRRRHFRSGQRAVLLDKNDQPLGNAILSSDRRAWRSSALAAGRHSAKALPVNAPDLWTGHPASLLRWVKENEPQRYAQIGCVMMGHDYLRWCLTGVKGCEESNISESNLYNMTTGQYDPCLTQWLGISEIDARCRRLSVQQKSAGKSPLRQPPLPVWRRELPSWAVCLMWFPPRSAPV